MRVKGFFKASPSKLHGDGMMSPFNYTSSKPTWTDDFPPGLRAPNAALSNTLLSEIVLWQASAK